MLIVPDIEHIIADARPMKLLSNWCIDFHCSWYKTEYLNPDEIVTSECYQIYKRINRFVFNNDIFICAVWISREINMYNMHWKKILSFTTGLQALTTDLLLICEDITFLYQPSHIKIACINKVVHIIKLCKFFDWELW